MEALDRLVDIESLRTIELIPDTRWENKPVCPYAHTGSKGKGCVAARNPSFFDTYCSKEYLQCPVYTAAINPGTPEVCILKIGENLT